MSEAARRRLRWSEYRTTEFGDGIDPDATVAYHSGDLGLSRENPLGVAREERQGADRGVVQRLGGDEHVRGGLIQRLLAQR